MSTKLFQLAISKSAFVLVLLLLLNFSQPAQAQLSYPFGSYLLWPLTAASYQLMSGSGYLLGGLLQRGTYAPYGYVPYGSKFGLNGSQQNNAPFGYGNSNNPYWGNSGNSYGNGSGSNPSGAGNGYGLGAGNGVVAGNGYGRGGAYGAVNGYPATSGNSQGNGQGNNSIGAPSNSPGNFSGGNSTGNSGAAGGYSGNDQGGRLPPISSTIAAAPEGYNQGVPLASVFIKLVNEKYDGDIYKSLRDKELYSWAQSLYLVSPENGYNHLLSPNKSRRQTIARVLKDGTISPNNKIEILKILMRP
jgi:hypothetical protein